MNSQKYEEAVEQYMDIVYRTALSCTKNKQDAEDVMQNTFIKLLQTDTCFSDDDHMRRWLIHVAVNECKSLWRSYWHKNVSSLEDYEPTSTDGNSVHQDVFDAVMRLPQKYSLVVHLYYYEGYSAREISEILKISQNNVQIRLMRARTRLKKQKKAAASI
ncbi:MAG: RNA polymerase sigma factor [Lachnospiraceae bacterium]|nr:RNA polymerase sigma factor [Lachnospiraceae bacterium]